MLPVMLRQAHEMIYGSNKGFLKFFPGCCISIEDLALVESIE